MVHPAEQPRSQDTLETPRRSATRRCLTVICRLVLTSLLTAGITSLIPISDDTLGWGMRGLLFGGMWWALR
jgi:hypothetical protein